MRFRALKPRSHHRQRRFLDWLNPPSCCDVCGGPAVLVDNAILYGKHRGSWPYVYFCLCCEASVGCHSHSIYPKGLMADARTRGLRIYVHGLLDPLWQEGRMTRTEAYALLARLLEAPGQVHIGEMGWDDCRRATKLLQDYLLVEDFG